MALLRAPTVPTLPRLAWPLVAGLAWLVAAVGGWLALRFPGWMEWLFAAVAFGMVSYGGTITVAVRAGVWRMRPVRG